MKDNLLIKTVIVLLAGLSFGIIGNLGHPVTSEYVRQLGFKEQMFGYLFSGMSLGMIISSPIWGKLGDKYKTRYLVAIAYMLYGCGQFMFSSFSSQIPMIIARFFSGFAVAGITINIYSYIYRAEFKLDGKVVLSYYIPLSALGQSIGYLIGGTLGVTFAGHVEYVLKLQAIVAFLFGIIMFLVISEDESMPSISSKHVEKSERIPITIILLFLISFLFAFGITNINKFLDVFINGKTDGNTAAVGNFVFTTGIVKLVVSILFVPLAVKSSKNRLIAALTQILGGLLVIFTFSSMNDELLDMKLHSSYMVAMALLEFSLPITIQLIRENSTNDLAYNLGLRQMFFSVGLFSSTLIGGFLYGYNVQLFFIINAIVLIIGGTIFLIRFNDMTKGKSYGQNRN